LRPRSARRVYLGPLSHEASEQELLASLLSYSQSNMCADVLLRHFHSIGHVLSAEPAQLKEFGVTERDLQLLNLVREAACRMVIVLFRRRPSLGNWQALTEYCQTAMGYQQIEQFRVLFLDRKNNLIADEVQQHGTVNHTPVYPREVAKRALI